MPLQTLYLDPGSWDLALDASGNIALASAPYAVAQDAASEIRLFSGELWYDASQGIPYWGQVLGEAPPVELIRAQFVSAALKVPDAVTAKVFFTSFDGRQITGQAHVTDSNGQTAAIGF